MMLLDMKATPQNKSLFHENSFFQKAPPLRVAGEKLTFKVRNPLIHRIA